MLSTLWAAITGAVIAIFCEVLLPLEIYLNNEENAALAGLANYLGVVRLLPKTEVTGAQLTVAEPLVV